MRITAASSPALVIGDRISLRIPVHDKRRWPRFVAWILRRPRPVVTVTRYFEVKAVVSGTELEIGEQS